MSKEADIPPQEIDRRLFLLIRVPKSGSTSLVKMVDAACPNARHFGLPDETKLTFGRDPDEVIRHFLTRYKRLLRPYGTWSFEKALAAIGAQAKPGDILSGHVSFDRVVIPGWEIAPITLVRDPFTRLLSDFNYSRVGFEKLDPVNRAIRRGHLRAAGTLGLDGYVDFVWERRDEFGDSATRMLTGSSACDDPIGFLRRRYFHYGALERLDAFAQGLSEKLGAAAPVAHANRTERVAAVEFSARARAKVEDMFGRDLALHEAIFQEADALYSERSQA